MRASYTEYVKSGEVGQPHTTCKAWSKISIFLDAKILRRALLCKLTFLSSHSELLLEFLAFLVREIMFEITENYLID